MEETWEEVPGWEDRYLVSDLGRIQSLPCIARDSRGRSIHRVGRLRVPRRRSEYFGITLNKNGVRKIYQVHVLVALAFIPNPDKKPNVNHKNGITTDNRAVNLEWCTQSENVLHSFYVTKTRKAKQGADHHKAKLSEQQVMEIRAKYEAGMKRVKMAKEYNISTNQVWMIAKRKAWSHI